MIYLIVILWHRYKSLGSITQGLKKAFITADKRMTIVLSIVLIVFFGIFIQRYGVNVVKYHSLTPSCDKVLNDKRCASYSPWERNYADEQIKATDQDKLSYSSFVDNWFYGMWFRSYFTLGGTATQFETRGPFILPSISAIVFVVSGLVLFIYYFRRIIKVYSSPVVLLFIALILIYCFALFIDDLLAYLQTAQPVAINGRYLILIYPMLILLLLFGFNEILKKKFNLKVLLFLVAILLSIWGGGALPYILRGRAEWYWPNHYIFDVNNDVKRIIGPITPGYYYPDEFLITQQY